MEKMKTMKRYAINAEGATGKSGPKFTEAAKGGDLAMGLAHMEKIGSQDGMYPRPMPESNQLPPKGSDRI